MNNSKTNDKTPSHVGEGRGGVVHLGEMNHLKVTRRVDFGFYLEGDEMGDILLPRKEAPRRLHEGDELDVFVYLDQEERRVATTITPRVMVGQTACLQVAWVNKFGAFMDWGLMKDLFVPFGEQKKRMNVGEWHTVYVYVDDVTHRIVGSSKVERFTQRSEREKVADFSEVLLARIKSEGGQLMLGDKSPAEEIYSAFGVSKKVFKQAVGALYRQHLVTLTPESITLV